MSTRRLSREGISGSMAKSRPTLVMGPMASSVTSPGFLRMVVRRKSRYSPMGNSVSCGQFTRRSAWGA